ncbi:hypothetical protein XU18_2858 [Perkinsela sp. CCAP 1560/4]|nr:hypothetical protein XU18_2858 [Perkinsela sp. CCAP 1560/4]|eukprot:KNH06353.1 hypothetical protein XU18_2858 [Perkinsela sp. CCAP 1560/4]
MLDDDLKKEWLNSRGKDGPGNYNSGFSTNQEIKWDEHKTPITPVAELAKFMPDIRVEGIQSTPVSMMNVRNGHRVTHDLLHSYDPAISRQVQYKSKEDGMTSPMIDHTKISPLDMNFFGLHPQTIGSRARIYRYLRRSPFSDESFYYRRYVQPYQPTESQRALHHEIVTSCEHENDIEKASSLYRLLTHAPTIMVVKAMLDCCARSRLLGDAAALFEDFRRTNRNDCRSKEVLSAYMDVAIACDHPQHAISILGYVQGTTIDNFRYTGVTEVEKFLIGQHLLVWLLQKGYPEARSVYHWMKQRGFLDYDRHYRAGSEIRRSLQLYLAPHGDSKRPVTAEMVKRMIIKHTAEQSIGEVADDRTEQNLLRVTQLHMDYRMFSHGMFSPEWLQQEFKHLQLSYVSQLAEYIVKNRLDSSATDESFDKFHAKVTHETLLLLQPDVQRSAQHTILPYLHKSTPSCQNPCIRVIHSHKRSAFSDTDKNPEFFFANDGSTRFVSETFEVLDNLNVRQIYHGRMPIHTPESVECWN